MQRYSFSSTSVNVLPQMLPIKITPLGIFAVAGLVCMVQSSGSAEQVGVCLGDTVLLGCSASYHTETFWVRQNTEEIPAVVLISGPNRLNGEVFSRNSLSPRFTAVPNAEDKTNQLRIINVTDADLALFFCVWRSLGMLQFGNGTRLHRVLEAEYCSKNGLHPDQEQPDSGHEAEPPVKEQGVTSYLGWPSFYTIYAAVLGLGQLGMICAVFTVHLRSRGASNPRTAPRAPRRRRTLPN